MEIRQRGPDKQAFAADREFTNGLFVGPRTLLDHRNGAPHLAHRLEIPQQDHSVGEVGHIDGSLHVADQSMLGDGQEGRGPLAVQVLEQFVDVEEQEVLFRHGRLIAVQAVDHDRLDPFRIHAIANLGGEFAGGQFRRVHLLDHQVAVIHHRLQIDPHCEGAVEQQPHLLVEGEQRRLFPSRDRGDDEVERQQ